MRIVVLCRAPWGVVNESLATAPSKLRNAVLGSRDDLAGDHALWAPNGPCSSGALQLPERGLKGAEGGERRGLAAGMQNQRRNTGRNKVAMLPIAV